MPSIGAILWGALTIWDMWRALRANDPTWALMLRGCWSLLTVLLIAGGWGTAFLIANVIMYSAALGLVGLSLLVMPPPLARDVARVVMEIGFTIAFAALCWALG
jgi:hypothetical protein